MEKCNSRNWLLGAAVLFALLLGLSFYCLTPQAAYAAEGDVTINETNFPDSVFRAEIKKQDTDSNGVLSKEEIDNIKILSIYSWGGKMSSLKGVEYLTSLEKLSFSGHTLTDIDLSKNTALKELSCSNNGLTELDLSKNTALTYLECNKNELTSLDLSKNASLEKLKCEQNGMTSLNIKGCSNLQSIDVKKNELTSIEVKDFSKLTSIDVSENKLTTLDAGGCTALTTLYCNDNELTDLNIGESKALQLVNCSSNKLTELSVSDKPELQQIACDRNQLTELTLSNCPAMYALTCNNNKLTTLDVTGMAKLQILWCYSNELTSMDLSGCTSLDEVCIDHYNETDYTHWPYTDTPVESLCSYTIMLNADRTYDLSRLPGNFDVEKASNWEGASVDGSILKLEDGISEVTYTYDCGEKQSAKFMLTAKEHEHAYEWVIDKEATATKNGIKHEECSCGLTRNENTIIPATGTDGDKGQKQPAEKAADKAAETGDDADLVLWASILLISAAIAAAAVLYNRKKHTVR